MDEAASRQWCSRLAFGTDLSREDIGTIRLSCSAIVRWMFLFWSSKHLNSVFLNIGMAILSLKATYLEEITVISAIFRTIFGAAFGVICALVLSPALAAFQSEGSSARITVMLIIVVGVAALGFFAPTIRHSLGHGVLLVGISFFALPISALLLSGRAAGEVVAASVVADQTATAIGGGLEAALMTGAGTFIGLIFGTIFTILGLVLALGGRREVIVVTK